MFKSVRLFTIIMSCRSSGTADCTRLCRDFVADCDFDITCTSAEICQGLYWVDDDHSRIGLVADAAIDSPPVTCPEATDVLFQIAQQGNLFSVITSILAADVIPQTVLFPFGDLDVEILRRIQPLLEELDQLTMVIVFADLESLCGPESTLRQWGLSIELMIAAIHNMGGVDRLSSKCFKFASLSLELIQTLEDLLTNGENASLLLHYRTGESVLARRPTLSVVSGLLRHPMPANVHQYSGLEQFVNLIESVPLDLVSAVCQQLIPTIINLFIRDNSVSHLLVRIGIRCGELLPLNIRREIADEKLLSTCGYSFDGTFEMDIEVNQQEDDGAFFLASAIALDEFDKPDFMLRPFGVIFTDTGSSGAGVVRAWLSRIVNYIFTPESGLFEFTDERNIFVKPAPINPGFFRRTRLNTYRQIGRIFGLAWRTRQSLGVQFSHSMAGFLSVSNNISAPYMFSWLKSDDPVTFDILTDQNILLEAGNIFFNEDDPSDLTVVNESNVEEYVEKQLWLKTIGSIESQLIHIAFGFYDVVPYPTLDFFTVEEIQNRFYGPRVIDRNQLEETTTYLFDSSLFPSDRNRTVSWIWEIIHAFNETEIADFLEFVSGSPFPPTNGFAETGAATRGWLQIQIIVTPNPLPISHTCFKTILFGLYDSIEILRDRLVFAITNTKLITLP